MAQQKSGSRHEPHTKPLASGSQLFDPVCGMQVTENSPQHVQHKGESSGFCSVKRSKTFKCKPKKFPIQRVSDEEDYEQVVPGAIYTCPTHPEMRLDFPGICPNYGMALKQQIPCLNDNNPKLKGCSLRLWWTLPFTAAVSLRAMFGARAAADYQRTGVKAVRVCAGLPYRRGSIKRLVIGGINSVELDLCARHSSKLINIFSEVRG